MALLYKRPSPLHGVWRMEESSGELLGMLGHAAEYAPFLERVTAEGRRRERLASRVLLRELLGVEARVGYRPSGAPFLVDMPSHVSISHTRGYVAVILDGRPTGIDIEYRSDRVLKVRDRFLAPDEVAAIDPGHEVEHLLIHWCAKETLFKIIGQEGVDFRRHLRVDPFPYSSGGTLTAREIRTAARREYRLAYRVEPDYVLTWLE